jgi:hypothetical protein
MEDNKFKRRVITMGTQHTNNTLSTKKSGPLDLANLRKKGVILRDQESRVFLYRRESYRVTR